MNPLSPRAKHIGRRIHRLRVEKGMSQSDLAQSVGIGQAAVSKWERGLQIPVYDVARRLAAAFDTTVDELFEGDEVEIAS